MYQECECGIIIEGFSEKHLRGNMKIHKTSGNHKTLLELKRKWFNEFKQKMKKNNDDKNH